MKAIPNRWASGDLISEADRLKMHLLRLAGCECELPLLGNHLNKENDLWLPRCRLCNTEAATAPEYAWLNVFANILEAWGNLEGTWYQGDWRDFGVTEEQEKAIVAAWEKKYGDKYKMKSLTPVIKQVGDQDYEVCLGDAFIATCTSSKKAKGLSDLIQGAIFAKIHLRGCDDREADVAELGASAMTKLDQAFVGLGIEQERSM